MIASSTLLVILSLAGVVPLIAFAIFSLDQFADRARSVDHERLAGQAINISSMIDRDIETLVAAGGALATSPSLAEGNYREFHREARLAMNHAMANVVLLDTSLQQLANTRVPYGEPLPATSNPESALRVIKSGEMEVSDIFFGKVSRMRVFDVTMPVRRNGLVTHLLIVTAEPKRIETLIGTYWLRNGWHTAVSDRTGVVFASTLDGVAGSSKFKTAAAPPTNSGLVETAIDGVASTMSYAQSQLTGWTTTVWAPHTVLDEPLAATWRNLFSASLLAIALSAVLGYVFQRPFSNLIQQALAAVAQIGRQRQLPEIKTFLSEGAVIDRSLAEANAALLDSRKEAEEGRALLDTLLDHIPEGITIVGGADFRVIANSRKAVEMTGRTPEELKVATPDHAAMFGIWFPDGVTRPDVTQLPLYRASRLGESIEEEYFALKRPDGSQITIEAFVNPVRDTAGRIIGAISCWRDVTQRLAAERAIADNEKRMRLALSVAGMAIIDIDIEKGVITGLSNGASLLGLEAEPGEALEAALPRLLENIHPGDRAAMAEAQKNAIAAPGPFFGEFRVVRPDGSISWIESRGETIADNSGRAARLLAANVDITSRKRAEEHLQLVQRELTHRAKNLLTIILAIATQTARRNTTLEQFLAAFSRRIQGLGASHDLLVKRDWTGVPLDELVESQLRPFGGVDGRRIGASGPPISLKPDVLQNLGLALHELGTNASKYGALSRPEGAVEIKWTVDSSGPEPRFHMAWSERGGPRVKPPASRGFGHVIIERSLAKVINGDVKLAFEPTGVVWSVDTLLSAVAADH